MNRWKLNRPCLCIKRKTKSIKIQFNYYYRIQFICWTTYLSGYSIWGIGSRVSSNSSSAFEFASENDNFGRFLKIRTLFGCELSLAPIIISPFNLMLPVNGILNKSSSSASLSTNWNQLKHTECDFVFVFVFFHIESIFFGFLQVFYLIKI